MFFTIEEVFQPNKIIIYKPFHWQKPYQHQWVLLIALNSELPRNEDDYSCWFAISWVNCERVWVSVILCKRKDDINRNTQSTNRTSWIERHNYIRFLETSMGRGCGTEKLLQKGENQHTWRGRECRIRLVLFGPLNVYAKPIIITLEWCSNNKTHSRKL